MTSSSATPRPAPPPTPAASAASSAPWWLERAQEARAKRYPQTPPNDRAQRVTASDLLARVEAALEEEAGAVVARLKRAGVASVPTASEVREQLLDLALGAWLAATDTNAARARHPLGYFPDDLLSALPGKERTILDGAAHAIERRWLREHAPPASTPTALTRGTAVAWEDGVVRPSPELAAAIARMAAARAAEQRATWTKFQTGERPQDDPNARAAFGDSTDGEALDGDERDGGDLEELGDELDHKPP
jgi:hypothetical protein